MYVMYVFVMLDTQTVSVSKCLLFTIDTATANTIVDKINQAVPLVRLDDVRLNQLKLQTYVYFYFCCIIQKLSDLI